MRSLIAMLMHETNTFSPIPTTLQRFQEWSGLTGTDALSFYRDTRTAMGAFLDLAEQWGDDIVCPIAAEAMPSAPADSETYDYLSGLIIEDVRKGMDRILLALHGAMITENTWDGEGTLLSRIRMIAPDSPIAVAHDFHANVTASTVANCNILTGYKTYPHTVLYETGHRAGSILYDAMQGHCNPVNPSQVQGKVTNLTDGRFRIDGPMHHGPEVCMGPTAVLDTGKMQIIVVSRHIEPWDPGLFHSLGIDPE